MPNMIYFSPIFMRELTVKPANNEPHPIFRMMKSNTMRWMYCEPEDHSIYSPGGFIHNNSKSSILQEQIVLVELEVGESYLMEKITIMK